MNQPKRKSLFVDAHTFDEKHQGIRTFLKGLYASPEFNKKDMTIYLAANNIQNLKEEFSNQVNFQFIKLKSKNKYYRLAIEIPRLIKNHNFDFAHFNYYLPLFLNKKCKYIVTIHDVLFLDYPHFFPLKYRFINKFMFWRSAINANIVTTVSNYSSKQISHHFKLSNKSINIIPNAIGSAYLVNRSKDEDRNYVLNKYKLSNYIIFVSRFEARKNHRLLLQAYKELELYNKGYRLVFVGYEAFKDKTLVKTIEELNTISKQSVFTMSSLNNSELVKFYNAAQLAVFPSLAEGFGIPPLESAVLKTPTLCANVTAMKDFKFLGDGFFNPEDINSLKVKIEIALSGQFSDKELENISAIIKERYNWDHSAKKLKNIILNETK